MRTIKFRGKLVDTQEWTFGSLVECHNGRMGIVSMTKYCEENGIEALIDEVLPETVGQYTGLKGKAGKKIYEGDIVNVSWGVEKFPMQVLFRKGEWVLNEYEDDTYNSLYDFKPEELEVIGNIFDDVELLEGGEE